MGGEVYVEERLPSKPGLVAGTVCACENTMGRSPIFVAPSNGYGRAAEAPLAIPRRNTERARIRAGGTVGCGGTGGTA